jgi:hypothetical protein
MANPTVLVGNRTGGQGKTLVTQLINYGYHLSEHPQARLVAADSVKDGGNAGVSKLGQIYPNVEELGIGANFSEMSANGRAAVSYWDKIGGYLKNGDAIIDFGANVLPVVFDWAQQRHTKRILQESVIHLVVPITAQRQSMLDGFGILQKATAPDSELRPAKIFVIFNEVHGSFASLQSSPEYRQIQKFISTKANNATSLSLSLCRCEVWERIEADFMRMHELVDSPYGEWERIFDIDEFMASASQTDYCSWMLKTLLHFREAGLIPEGKMPEALSAVAA